MIHWLGLCVLTAVGPGSIPSWATIKLKIPQTAEHGQEKNQKHSSCLQSFPASGSFQMSQLFVSGGQSIGVSALASVLPKNTQDLSPLEWTGWVSLQSKGLSRVFSNTTVKKHQFFGAQPSS